MEEQTHHPLGYVEHLCTFADRDRGGGDEARVPVSHLGLTREMFEADGLAGAGTEARVTARFGRMASPTASMWAVAFGRIIPASVEPGRRAARVRGRAWSTGGQSSIARAW